MSRVIQVPLSILCVEIRRTANEVYYASSERLHGPWPRFDWCYNGAFATNGSAVNTGTVYMAGVADPVRAVGHRPASVVVETVVARA